MEQEKKPLPPVKELLEQMYGVKAKELTPEEKAHIHKLIEQSRQIGQKNT